MHFIHDISHIWKYLSFCYDRYPQTVESVKKNLNRKFKNFLNFDVSKKSAGKNALGNVFLDRDVELYYDEGDIKTFPGVKYIRSVILEDQGGDDRFGEWSGMGFLQDGSFIAISDRGAYLIGKEKENFIIGDIVSYSKRRDFEELIVYGDNCYISDESSHEMLFYEKCDFEALPRKIETPYTGDFSQGKEYINRGMEGVAISPEGVFIAISEFGKDEEESLIGVHSLYCWQANKEGGIDNINFIKSYFSDPGFGVSGIAFLPNGDLLVLERWYEMSVSGLFIWYEILIKHVPHPILYNKDSSVVSGRTIVKIDNDNTSDRYSFANNFESITVRRDDNGIRLYILSDDNRAPFEQTMFLEFAIDLEVISNV